MRISVVAIGQRLPAWAATASADYARRLPAEWRFEITTLKAEARNGRNVAALLGAERQRIEAALPKAVRRVALDERGSRLTTTQLAERVRAWQRDGRDVVFLIGGPDGLDAELLTNADERIRLSDLTLPHALARVLLVEALYRAHSLDVGHPYHRE